MGLENGKSVSEYLSGEVVRCYLHLIMASLFAFWTLLFSCATTNELRLTFFHRLKSAANININITLALFFNQSRNKDIFHLVSFRRIESIRL